MTKLPIIIDDLFNEEFQDQIEDLIFDCTWIFNNDNTFGSEDQKTKYRKILSPLEYKITPNFVSSIQPHKDKKIFEKIITLLYKSCNEINFNVEKIKRCRASIHAVIRSKLKIDNIHINSSIPHLVLIYYVNDSDGDTILYDKTLNDIPYNIDYPEDFCELNIVNRITPKRGRILFFDGRVYHASSSPEKSVRCIITLDLFGQFADGSYKFPAPKETIKTNFMYQ